jgi:hypothetical protein
MKAWPNGWRVHHGRDLEKELRRVKSGFQRVSRRADHARRLRRFYRWARGVGVAARRRRRRRLGRAGDPALAAADDGQARLGGAELRRGARRVGNVRSRDARRSFTSDPLPCDVYECVQELERCERQWAETEYRLVALDRANGVAATLSDRLDGYAAALVRLRGLDSRAREQIRVLVGEIRLPPYEGHLLAYLTGDLFGLLGLTSKRSDPMMWRDPETPLVAGFGRFVDDDLIEFGVRRNADSDDAEPGHLPDSTTPPPRNGRRRWWFGWQ